MWFTVLEPRLVATAGLSTVSQHRHCPRDRDALLVAIGKPDDLTASEDNNLMMAAQDRIKRKEGSQD
jgi:hypothetical protein